jgi:CRP/FNR family transcriptional regulator
MISGMVEFLNGLVDPSKAIRYPSGVELLQQDRRSSCAFLILSGITKLVHLDQNGREVIVGLRRPGWMVGSSALILNEPNYSTAVTVTSAKLIRFDAEEFEKLVKTEPRFSEYLQQQHARELNNYMQNLVEMASLSAVERLSKFLSDVEGSFGLGLEPLSGETTIPLKHWEIAELLGVTPEHLSRLLKVLESKGLLHRKGSTLLLSRIIPGAHESEPRTLVLPKSF